MRRLTMLLVIASMLSLGLVIAAVAIQGRDECES
jgi:hypothetical protein